MGFFEAVGLSIGLVGSIVILTPRVIDVSGSKSSDLKEAKNTLFNKEEALYPGDRGFEEMEHLLRDLSVEPINSKSPDAILPRSPGRMGSGGNVHFVYGVCKNSPKKMTRDNFQEEQRIRDQFIVHNQLNAKISTMDQKAHQQYIYFGAILLAASFSLQLFSVLFN